MNNIEEILKLIDFLNFDYFQKYSLFSNGLILAGYLYILFFLFVYSSFRGYKKDAFELSFNILTPLFIIAFFMSITGFPSRIIGLIVILGFGITIKYFTKINNKKVLILITQLILILAITNSLNPFFGNLLFYGLIIYNFIKGELEVRKNSKKNN